MGIVSHSYQATVLDMLDVYPHSGYPNCIHDCYMQISVIPPIDFFSILISKKNLLFTHHGFAPCLSLVNILPLYFRKIHVYKIFSSFYKISVLSIFVASLANYLVNFIFDLLKKNSLRQFLQIYVDAGQVSPLVRSSFCYSLKEQLRKFQRQIRPNHYCTETDEF